MPIFAWGLITLALLLGAGCTRLDRNSSSTSGDTANVPEFRLVTVTVALSPTPRFTETQYTVQEGDTLSAIASQFGVTWDAIIQANNLESQDAIYVGQVLTIPAPAPATPAAAP